MANSSILLSDLKFDASPPLFKCGFSDFCLSSFERESLKPFESFRSRFLETLKQGFSNVSMEILSLLFLRSSVEMKSVPLLRRKRAKEFAGETSRHRHFSLSEPEPGLRRPESPRQNTSCCTYQNLPSTNHQVRRHQ
ncbi:hypothetical protein IGI04_036343, partial [Brassica rapa subsp. trilocularis]